MVTGKRPKIRTIKVETVENSSVAKRVGPDLNDVLRGVLVDLKETWGLSTRALARRLGLSQQQLSSFLEVEADQGTRIETLSRICASLNMSPGELFSLHPDFGAESYSKGDRMWMILRNSISEKAMQDLIKTAMLGSQIGTLDRLIANQLEMVTEIAEARGIDVAGISAQAKKVSSS